MIGAIAGDIIGSVYENNPIKTKNFPLFHPRCTFTDDSVPATIFSIRVDFPHPGEPVNRIFLRFMCFRS